MNNYDLIQHVKGESLFVDDLVEPKNLHYAYVIYSSKPAGKIESIEYDPELMNSLEVSILTHKDIPGQNQIGGIILDEELLASTEVHYVGHPIAIVVAKNLHLAKKAAKNIKINITEHKAIFDEREAYKNNRLICEPVIFENGNVDEAWKECEYILSDTVRSGGQEHLYLETQISLAMPVEGEGIKVISSTQSPTAVQRIISRVLNIPMHYVEVDVLRLGGGFGGKEDQATPWATMAALAAFKLKVPVKIMLDRQDDMRMTGKRHPYSSDFKIGLNRDGKILAYEVTYYQNSGSSADLSTAILERTLFHCTNSYYIPNVRAKGICCKTNLPSNTAFRGFGGPQAMFVIESAIYRAAEKIGVEPYIIQEKNLLKDGDEFYYGQKIENSLATKCFEQLKTKIDINSVQNKIQEFNNKNKLCKRGFALMPICFGISFTSTGLNQAGSLVHIYTDGSVTVSTAAVEMGQGVNMKIRQVASSIFSLPIEMIKIQTTNTTRIANTSPTAASSGADLNGRATEIACNEIKSRLIDFLVSEFKLADKNSIEFKDKKIIDKNSDFEITWEKLINTAYWKRINLSAYAHYATPGIYFDRNTKKGNPFAYHVYGCAAIQVSVDCLRGVYEIDSVDIVHDFGKSMNKAIDKSQVEGALMQGIGWMTIEEIKFNENGKLMNDALSTYKVPDIYFTPKRISIEFAENPYPNKAIFNSKAIGEPPFMYGIGIYFAIANAIKAFNKDVKINFDAPFTPEKVLMKLYE